MNRSVKLVFTIVCSFIVMLIYYLIDFFLTPFITATLGTEAYGYVSIARTFISYASIITIAINSYATRYIALAYHEGDEEKCKKYFNSVLLADILLGLIIFFVFIFIIWKLEFIINIPTELIEQVKLLFLLTTLNFVLTTIGTVFTSAAYIKNQLDKINIFKGISYIFDAIFLILLFSLCTAKLWYVGIGSVAAAIVVLVSNIYIHKKYLPSIKISKSKFSFTYIKELVLKGMWNSINSLGNMLNTGLDLIVTNLWINPLAAGQLAISKSISTIFVGLFQLIAQPFQPILLEDYSKEDTNKLINDFKTSMILSGLLSNLAFAGFFALGLCFYNLWIPGEDTNLIWQLTVITILGSVFEGVIYPLYYIYVLTIKNKIPSIVTIIGGVLNVFGMFILIHYTKLGVYSVTLTTSVIMFIISFIVNPIYMCKCLNIRKVTFYPTLLRHVLSATIMTFAFWGIATLINPSNWIGLILTALLCVICGMIIHFVVFWKNPKTMLLSLKK